MQSFSQFFDNLGQRLLCLRVKMISLTKKLCDGSKLDFQVRIGRQIRQRLLRHRISRLWNHHYSSLSLLCQATTLWAITVWECLSRAVSPGQAEQRVENAIDLRRRLSPGG